MRWAGQSRGAGIEEGANCVVASALYAVIEQITCQIASWDDCARVDAFSF